MVGDVEGDLMWHIDPDCDKSVPVELEETGLVTVYGIPICYDCAQDAQRASVSR